LALSKLQKEIIRIKEKENAILLAHNYQIIEIQEIADFIGDSYDLAVKAAQIENAEYIIFCGVDFMAETAAILNPNKTILIPDKNAQCPMAKMLPAKLVKDKRKEYPDAEVMVYVNTWAETKAEADVTCTSSNALKIATKLKSKTILFGPDRNLACYVEKRLPEKEIIAIPETGHCYVHSKFNSEPLQIKLQNPDAILMVHPEVSLELQERADYIGSTSQMYNYAKNSDHKKFIVATENGLIDRMRKEIPGKIFFYAKSDAICTQMKLHTLEKIKHVLENKDKIVTVPNDIALKARKAILKMVELTNE
jgi:quinolinate synthase